MDEGRGKYLWKRGGGKFEDKHHYFATLIIITDSTFGIPFYSKMLPVSPLFPTPSMLYTKWQVSVTLNTTKSNWLNYEEKNVTIGTNSQGSL